MRLPVTDESALLWWDLLDSQIARVVSLLENESSSANVCRKGILAIEDILAHYPGYEPGRHSVARRPLVHARVDIADAIPRCRSFDPASHARFVAPGYAASGAESEFREACEALRSNDQLGTDPISRACQLKMEPGKIAVVSASPASGERSWIRPRGLDPRDLQEWVSQHADERTRTVAAILVSDLTSWVLPGRELVIDPDSSGTHPVLVEYWGTWCEPCLENLHMLADQAEAVERAGIEIVTINLDGEAWDEERVAAYMSSIGLTGRHHATELGFDSSEARALGVTGIPTTIATADSGRIRWVGTERLTPERLSDLLGSAARDRAEDTGP